MQPQRTDGATTMVNEPFPTVASIRAGNPPSDGDALEGITKEQERTTPEGRATPTHGGIEDLTDNPPTDSITRGGKLVCDVETFVSERPLWTHAGALALGLVVGLAIGRIGRPLR